MIVVVDHQYELPVDGHVTRAPELRFVLFAVGARGRGPSPVRLGDLGGGGTDEVALRHSAVRVDDAQSRLAALADDEVAGRQLGGLARTADVRRQFYLTHPQSGSVGDQLQQPVHVTSTHDQHAAGGRDRQAARFVRHLPLADRSVRRAHSVHARVADVGHVEALVERARGHVVRVVSAETGHGEAAPQRVVGGRVDVELLIRSTVAQHEQFVVEQRHAAHALRRPRLVYDHF